MKILIEAASLLLASALVMILHELPKSVMYVMTSRHCRAGDKRQIWKLHRYIDPVGWILFMTCHAGCSRPYPYRLKEKDTNIAIGLTGFLALGVMIMGGYALNYFKVFYMPGALSWEAQGVLRQFMIQANWYFNYAAVVLLIVNLIPVISSDISLLIIALSPKQLIPLLKNDTMIKGLFVIAAVFGWISQLAVAGIGWLDRLFGYV